MRTMRLKKREIRDKEVLRDLIDGCSVVRIGAADEEGMFIVPVNYGYELLEKEDGTLDWKLYFHSAAQGRKAEAFAKEMCIRDRTRPAAEETQEQENSTPETSEERCV